MSFLGRRCLILATAVFLAAGPAASAFASEEMRWDTEFEAGNETMCHLLEAVSGKRTGENTRHLMRGVTSIIKQENDFRLIRADGAELIVPRESKSGERMFSCMEKLERTARKKISEEAAQYVHNVDALIVDGDSIELRHSGKENFDIPLPTNQPWLPVKLKEIRVSNIKLNLVEGKENDVHRIKSIDGIAAIVSSAGVDLKIEPREFWRFKDKKGHTHIVFGIKSLVPGPVRHFLGLPEVMHVNLTIRKKKEENESS